MLCLHCYFLDLLSLDIVYLFPIPVGEDLALLYSNSHPLYFPTTLPIWLYYLFFWLNIQCLYCYAYVNIAVFFLLQLFVFFLVFIIASGFFICIVFNLAFFFF